MKICVLGLGYVGAVSAGCLAKDGHEVIGVDPERTKVDLINAGKSPIIEKDIGEIIHEQVAAGRLRATTEVGTRCAIPTSRWCASARRACRTATSTSPTCKRVCEQIGEAIATHAAAPVIVMRSTMLPGTMREVVIPILEKASGKKAGEEFGLCINPEFLREGTAVHDYYHPPKTVIGEVSRASGDAAGQPLRQDAGADDPHRRRDRGDGEVRRQLLARASRSASPTKSATCARRWASTRTA